MRDFVKAVATELCLMLNWRGSGLDEIAVDETGKTRVAVDARYFRPTEAETLLGDATKARTKLGWSPRTDFATLVKEMTAADLQEAKQIALSQAHGFPILSQNE